MIPRIQRARRPADVADKPSAIPTASQPQRTVLAPTLTRALSSRASVASASVATPASIPSPSFDDVHLGPFTFHVYGAMYALAVLASIIITRRRWRAVGGDPDLVYEVALWGFPAGLIGARIYFLITSWDQAAHTWWGPVAVWDGGLGVWGGILAGTLAGIWVLRRRGADVPQFLDAAAPALLVAQSIGRIGNWFNQELFGMPEHSAVGTADLARPPRRRLRRIRHIPPHVPLRDPVEPRTRGSTRLARSSPPHPSRRAVRAVRRRLFALPDLRGAAARRSCAPHLRAAAELLHRRSTRVRGTRRVRATPMGLQPQAASER